ncbi:unnamed protein product [Coregonus sp. 'balchen']|nr:unnamed protein product [Coregonus sp. 'balchen']
MEWSRRAIPVSAQYAIDGKRNTNYGSCTYTEQDTNPWWRVDLLDVTRVTAVTITNRDDVPERLDGAEIHIGNSLENNGINNLSELIKNIQKRRKRDLTSTIKLLHQPGSGGTTMAKQVLWDMRKKLRCAVLTGPTSDITAIAKQVIHLFTAGSQRNQTTVLLMLEDERILENLQDAIIKEIAERNITTHKPVVIILNCVHPIYGGPSFEQRMEPFTHLIVTFPARQGQDKHVRMAHPLIAQQCVKTRDYLKAVKWAKIAKDRDPKSSFVADTLGQVYKNQLKSRIKVEQGSIRVPKEQGSFKVPEEQGSISAQDILQLSKKAFEAFKDEERAAENEQGADMQDDGMTKVSSIFNNRGLFGYLQVANIVFDSLVSLDKHWQKVLTMEISADSFFISIGQKKLFKYKSLISSLRDEVERICEFFDGYLIYSKPSIEKNEPPYFWTDVKNCYRKYVGTCTPIHSEFAIGIPLQKLKEEMAIAFPGLLSCLDKGYDKTHLRRITILWEEIKKEWEKKKVGDNKAAQNFILANIILSKVEAASPVLTPLPILRRILERHLLANFGNQTPEFYFLVLLLYWPEEHKKMDFDIDLNKHVLEMQDSYENTYKKYLRSRYLRPLIFLAKGEGLSRLVHSSKIDNLLARENPMARPKARQDFITKKWNSGEVWREPVVQDLLLPVNGVVRQHRVFACVDGKEIEVCAYQQSKVWMSGDVCFYLGFTIRGPVAYGIHYPSHSDRIKEEEPRKKLEVPDIKSMKDDQHFVDFHRTDLI